MRRSLRAILIITVTTVLALTAAPAARAEPAGRASSPPVPSLAWAPCGDGYPGAECTSATVPLDYDNPRAGTTQIALARIPAADQAHKVGSVFINPGGPGWSGVGMLLGVFGQFLASRLQGRFDVVGFDPRGVGGSEPLRCFDSQEDLAAFFAGQPIFPYLPAQYRPFFDRFGSYSDRCLDGRDRIAQHMSTADVARDLDLLRGAVGDPQLTYLGFSYGSYLGSTYASLFPKNVRALAIDGVVDPRLWSSGWQITAFGPAIQQEFNEFLRLCDQAGPDCAFAAPEGSAVRWEALATALRRQPLPLPDGTAYSYDILINDATTAMYRPEVWGRLGWLLDYLADAVLGDRGAAASASASAVTGIRQAIAQRLTPPAAQPDAAAGYDNSLDARIGNHCADVEYPHTFAAFRAIDRYAAAGSRFGPLWWWQVGTACAQWPVNPDRYTGPWRTTTANPVLVVGNYFDGITPYTGAKASAGLLTSSRLLSYAGWGHTAYGRSACVTGYINQYLLDRSLPAPGTVCPANPNPFLPSPARSAAASAPLSGAPPRWLPTP